ncbi:MAG: Rpn family recombination-promoting nuclease/putative transposase [Betaproteobacteria bacterium]|nr:Rpn family recombination-promoting nuclease/putative transposase [Betaproteobacteria bacterium]
MTAKSFYFASNDAMFKRIFGDRHNTRHLVSLLRAILDLPPEDYAEVSIDNPFLAREHPGDKLGILDIKVRTPTGKVIDIEIQLCNHGAIRERVVFYLARMVTGQVGASDGYWKIKRSICIFILDFNLVPEGAIFHNQYSLRDHAGAQFTDLMEVVTLELPKLPGKPDGTALWDWMRFVGARDKEVLEMLAEKNPEVKEAVDKLQDLNADKQARLEAESREKLRRDIAHYKLDAMNQGLAEGRAKGLTEGLAKGQAEGRAEGRAEGKAEGKAEGWTEASHTIARNALRRNMPAEEVMALTGLSKEEIQSLMH